MVPSAYVRVRPYPSSRSASPIHIPLVSRPTSYVCWSCGQHYSPVDGATGIVGPYGPWPHSRPKTFACPVPNPCLEPDRGDTGAQQLLFGCHQSPHTPNPGPFGHRVGGRRRVLAGRPDRRGIHVAGTTATDDGNLVGVGDPAAQTRQALANVGEALEDLDASLGDVVRTRLFVTDIDQWEAIGRAHGDVFDEIRPATSMVQVDALVDPDMLVEVEAVARLTD